MTTKLKIDLSQGVLEVEGSETFVKAIYNDFKAHFVEQETSPVEPELPARSGRGKNSKSTAKNTRQPAAPPPEPARVVEPAAPPVAELVPQPAPEPAAQPPITVPAPDKLAPPLPSYTYIENLNLGATGDHPALVEFMDAKLPLTNEERNLVFLYYLQYTLKIKSITLNHIYTCYREAKIRAPLNIENSLRMTASQRGWIKANQNGSMTVTPEGKNYVEKELPKKMKS